MTPKAICEFPTCTMDAQRVRSVLGRDYKLCVEHDRAMENDSFFRQMMHTLAEHQNKRDAEKKQQAASEHFNPNPPCAAFECNACPKYAIPVEGRAYGLCAKHYRNYQIDEEFKAALHERAMIENSMEKMKADQLERAAAQGKIEAAVDKTSPAFTDMKRVERLLALASEINLTIAHGVIEKHLSIDALRLLIEAIGKLHCQALEELRKEP
jgi:hypothetical protein